MRLFLSISPLCILAAAVFAQEDPGPSPTESVGCEPHGDHWHFDGPQAIAAPASTTAETEDPGPSPTESYDCEPHGAHWHCDGPLPGVTPAPATTIEQDHNHEHDDTAIFGAENDHEHDEDHASATHTHEETETPTFPPPTESIGCEPHGDHYHCDGPAPTGAAADAAVIASTSANNGTNGTSGDNGASTSVAPFTGGASVNHEGGKKLVKTMLMATMAAVAFAAFT